MGFVIFTVIVLIEIITIGCFFGDLRCDVVIAAGGFRGERTVDHNEFNVQRFEKFYFFRTETVPHNDL